MAFIRESIKNKILDAEIMVLEREKSEFYDPWHIISLEVDSIDGNITPKQLRKLGKWMVKEGKRIGKEYKSNGARRVLETNIEGVPISD